MKSTVIQAATGEQRPGTYGEAAVPERCMMAVLSLAVALSGCRSKWFMEAPVPEKGSQPSPSRGHALLLNKSYLKVGVPVSLTSAPRQPKLQPNDEPVRLGGRVRMNDLLPTGLTGRLLGREVPSATENCLLCHAGALRGRWVLGLGNSLLDAVVPDGAALIDLPRLEKLRPTPEEREVLDAWHRYQLAVLPYSRASTPGSIAALYFTGFFLSHRSKETLEWSAAPAYPMLDTPSPETDIPAWWLLKKKKCLYYGCELAGDFTRALMQFMAVPGNSAADIRSAEGDFEDILAYLRSLEAPRYPLPVDAELVTRGEAVFLQSCSKCHGEYGAHKRYPNKVVPLDRVGTDPARSDFMHRLGFAQHYRQTWYGEHSTMEATGGYLAPPLDGVWATAPYLHNGSVPTLDALLDPRLRPRYFVRPLDSRRYDLGRVGWEHEVLAHGKADELDPSRKLAIFDTTRYGKGNQGHDFAAVLSDAERRQLLEYLKTL